MEKTFDVEGIAKTMLIYRGGLLQVGKPFKVVMTENELNRFRPFIDDLRATEIVDKLEVIEEEPIVEVVAETSESEPIVENIENKEEDTDVVQQKSNVRANKNKHKN